MKKIYHCQNCGDRVPGSLVQSYEWAYYCPECADKIFYACEQCGEIEVKRFGEDYSTGLCENCHNEKLYS